MAVAQAQRIETATERYRRQLAEREAEIVDVHLPSGFTLQFQKPSKFGMLFRYGKMPQSAASGAVQAWIDAGVLKPGEIPEDQIKAIDEGIKLRDRVLELSHAPKLVVGEPQNENELSTDVLSDEDASYLFAWVSAGGDESLMLGTFPGRSQPSPVAGNGSPKRRHKAK